MDEMAKSNLETMIEMYKERKTNTDFVNFQETLKAMKGEVEEFKKGNPQFKSMIDGIIQEIEKYQTARYAGYIKRFYEGKISEITAMISRLKAFMSTSVSREYHE
ncbi:hypothetical protein KAU92_02855 [Candidatus Bathyarchaeota archaeon]|nr:hypothetical protein [Candidatus Bathyarchaeota archaeon]